MGNTFDLDEYVANSYKLQMVNNFEFIIALEFPKIKNLNVKIGEGNNFVITFDEGDYTGEEVEKKLEELRNYKLDIK